MRMRDDDSELLTDDEREVVRLPGELPGMWELSDLSGGLADTEDDLPAMTQKRSRVTR